MLCEAGVSCCLRQGCYAKRGKNIMLVAARVSCAARQECHVRRGKSIMRLRHLYHELVTFLNL